MQLSRRLGWALGLALLVGLAVLWLATSLPKVSGKWQVEGQQLWFQPTGEMPVAIRGLQAGERWLPADPHWLMPEPDMLDRISDYRRLLADVGVLQRELDRQQLIVVGEDGRQWQLEGLPRRPLALPGMFWLQWACGLAALLICLLIAAVRPADRVLRLFVLSGVGYAVSVLSAAVYSTRELFISAELWRALSWLNHAGGFLYAAALSSLFWFYPLRLPAAPGVMVLFFTAALLSLLANTVGWPDSFVLISYTWILLIFAGGVSGAVWQWRRTITRPQERAILRWLQVSVLLGTLIYTAFSIVPVLLGEPPLAEQGLLLAGFLLVYLGVAMGVLRYRLFDLERWSLRLWTWGLGGAAIIVVDVVLVGLLSWSGRMSLAVSAAVVGWLYFPLRQRLWRWLESSTESRSQRWLTAALADLVAAPPHHLPAVFAVHAVRMFQPLHWQWRAREIGHPELREHGEQLVIPCGGRQLELWHAANGRRLFSSADVTTARELVQLQQVIAAAVAAREQGMEEERERIQRDLHDDLGAALLELLHEVPEAQKSRVRACLQEMRQILRALDGKREPLEQVLHRCQLEARQRCSSRGVTLDWQQQSPLRLADASAAWINALEKATREAVTNALKHSVSTQVVVTLKGEATGLRLTFRNDGCSNDTVVLRRGLLIMQKRLQELEGTLQWALQGPCWCLEMWLPWSETKLDSKATE